MLNLRTSVLIGITALGISSLGHAQQGPATNPQSDTAPRSEASRDHRDTKRPSPEKMAEHAARRMNTLHDALMLTPQQEPAWAAFKEKIRGGQYARGHDRGHNENMTTPERMEKMLATMRDGEQRLSARLDATKTFYAVLTPAQRTVFDQHSSKWHHGGGHKSNWHHGGEHRDSK